METKHTKGNWHTTGLEVRDYKGMIVAQAYDHNQNNVSREECMANANLIAHAPELLNALMLAMKIVDLWTLDEEVSEDYDDEAIALNTMKITFEHAIKAATEQDHEK